MFHHKIRCLSMVQSKVYYSLLKSVSEEKHYINKYTIETVKLLLQFDLPDQE